MKIALTAFLVGSVLAVMLTMLKSGNFFKSLLKAFIQGITSMMAVNVLGLLTGVTIAVNWYTLLTVSLFGLPSTVTLILLDTFLI